MGPVRALDVHVGDELRWLAAGDDKVVTTWAEDGTRWILKEPGFAKRLATLAWIRHDMPSPSRQFSNVYNLSGPFRAPNMAFKQVLGLLGCMSRMSDGA